jgi:hypothetical protein
MRILEKGDYMLIVQATWNEIAKSHTILKEVLVTVRGNNLSMEPMTVDEGNEIDFD